MKFGFNRPSGFRAKYVWKYWIGVTLDEGHWMTLTFDILHIQLDWIYQLWYHRLQQFLKNPLFYLIPIQIKSIRDQIWPCRRQPRVIIWTNLVVLEHLMLHTNFQDHQLFGSREEDFLSFLPYMGMAAILPVCRKSMDSVDFCPRTMSAWNIGTGVHGQCPLRPWTLST